MFAVTEQSLLRAGGPMARQQVAPRRTGHGQKVAKAVGLKEGRSFQGHSDSLRGVRGWRSRRSVAAAAAAAGGG